MRRVVGCMTGTSMDGLDISLLEIEGSGLEMHTRVLLYGSYSLEPFQDDFRQIARMQESSVAKLLQLALDFGRYHGECIAQLVGTTSIDLVCVHGQTLYHKPPLSLQLMNPYPIAAQLQTPVVYDLRGMDLAVGGEGAPITPIADPILYSIREPTVIVNLGGFSNYTKVEFKNGKQHITGGDICVCNLLLNQLSRRFCQLDYDHDGKIAFSGAVHSEMSQKLISILQLQASGNRSLGTNDDEIQGLFEQMQGISPADILRTVCHAIASVIASKVLDIPVVILAGGGAYHQCLVLELQKFIRGKVLLSTDLGVPMEVRESACFAILGALCQDRVPITLPNITHSDAAFVSGSWVLP